MRYMLMIYGDEQQWVSAGDEQRAAIYARYEAFTAANSRVIRGGGELHPTRAASTVRVRGGETLVTDGPFAETKEQLGGFFIVDVADEEEARAIAAQIPDAENGSIEVRPLVEEEERPQAAASAAQGAAQ
jgi:hypothetical protein